MQIYKLCFLNLEEKEYATYFYSNHSRTTATGNRQILINAQCIDDATLHLGF